MYRQALLLIVKNQHKITEQEKNVTLPSTHLHNTKLSTANSSLEKTYNIIYDPSL